MADLRIVDAPEIPTEDITGEEKLPTGGNGNYSISLDSLADYTKTKKDLADNTSVDGKVNGVRQELNTHIEDLLNPHQVTKGQIGLGNVDNTADADKPVSNSTQAAIISAVSPKADKTYVDNQLSLKANKADIYTKSETYTKQESSDLVSSSISTALTPINASLDLARRGVVNRYDSSLTYNIGERVVLTNGDIVKSTIGGNENDPNSNMLGWVKDSQEIVASVSDLVAISNPTDHQVATALSRNAGTGKGGGVFVFHAGSTKNDGGMFFSTPSGSWHRLTLEVWHNVQWWGAVGDGVTDDTVSIKDAIKAHLKEYAPNKMPLASFCTLYFPASEGAYVVTETIYTLPYLHLKGDSTKGGSTAHNHTKYMSKIGAKFPNAINYKWIISTENYVTATGELINWDTTCTGEQLDAGLITPSFGSCIEDLWIDNLTPENRIYGGVRFIAAPQASIERCWIENVDVGVLFTGSWDIRCDVGTVAYKCGAAIWGSSNGTRMNGYLHANTNKTPLPTQMNIFDIPVDKTVGLYAQYAPSISSEMVISERHDHGIRLAAESYMSAQSLYLEANKTAMTLSSSTLNVGNITGVANDYTLKLGGGSTFDVASCQNNNYTNSFFESIDDYAISANIPETIVKADTANTKVFLKNRELKDVVYLSSSTGSDSNSGLISNNPVASLIKALDILSARRTSNQWSDVISDQRKVCTLTILDSADYSPNNYRELKNIDLTIKSSDGNTPRLKTSNQAFKLFNSTVRAKGINIQRTYDNNYQLSQGMFICSGSCSVVVECPNVDLAYPLVSVDPSDLADVNLSIIGGTGAMTADARYFQTTSKNTAINAFIRLNNTGYDLNGSSNNGIDAPIGTYITKSVSAVLP